MLNIFMLNDFFGKPMVSEKTAKIVQGESNWGA